MGSYLSEPITQKESIEEISDKLKCGASSMQGWRVSQEDAHNCILDFDKETSLFAVYDGHGGHEVALYCSQKLPDYLKTLATYKDGEFTKALEEAFLGFDATICTSDVMAILKDLAADNKPTDDSEEEEENFKYLYEEAAMPIEQVIEKYTSNLSNPSVKNVCKDEKQPASPYLKAKTNDSAAGSCPSSSSVDEAVSSSSNDTVVSTEGGNEAAPSTPTTMSCCLPRGESDKIPEVKIDSPDSSVDNKMEQCTPSSETADETHHHQNGDVVDEGKAVDSVVEKNDVTSSSSTPTVVENGEVVKKGKGKATTKTKGVVPNVKSRPKRSVQKMYAQLLQYDDGSEEDSEDEEDKTFEGPNDESSDDEDEGVNTAIECENSSDEDDDDDDDDDDEDDESDEADDMEDEENMNFAKYMSEEPGYNSGCTAVVALLHQNQLYVANAGDSRCIVCRDGKAVEMSFDHKPEDEPERERVVKAGGRVSLDGRVNGGLNLSRAIGDHAYKQNNQLSDKEQMITALPDVRSLTIQPLEDEFMVLACDGIWNFMSSQQVIDFVRPMIKEGKSLGKICEELFDYCLAPNTKGDGTGCDNMTAIIVEFKQNILKRSSSENDNDEPDNKRTKTDESKTDEAV